MNREKVWVLVPDCSIEEEPAVSEIILKTYTCLCNSYNVKTSWVKLNMFNSLRYDDEHGDLDRNSILVEDIFDILEQEKILKLIENYKLNLPLLENIDYDKEKFKELDKLIEQNIDSAYVFLSFWIFNIIEFLYIAMMLRKERKDIKLFARPEFN